jgi:hypothetical protein
VYFRQAIRGGEYRKEKSRLFEILPFPVGLFRWEWYETPSFQGVLPVCLVGKRGQDMAAALLESRICAELDGTRRKRALPKGIGE